MSSQIKTIKDHAVQNKRVLLRVDFNVSLDEEGSIADDAKMKETLPTIHLLLKEKNKLIIISHLGRPASANASAGKPEGRDKAFSLGVVAERLQKLLPKECMVTLVDDFFTAIGQRQIAQQKENEIMLLENIRFYKEEQANNEEFAKKLAQLGDIYVNDGFGVSHRQEASIVGIPKFLPSYAGLLLEKEVNAISALMKNPQRPFVAIIGGAKIDTKIGLLSKLLSLVDTLIIGGALANTFFLARGYDVGKSIAQPDKKDAARDLIDLARQKNRALLLPLDVIVGNPDDAKNSGLPVRVNAIPGDQFALDIGPETETLFCSAIARAKTIVWNGPVGYAENALFAHGTDTLYNAITQNIHAFSLVGGGDTLASIANKKHNSRITHISTGGGAMLELIEKGTLAGIEALKNRYQ